MEYYSAIKIIWMNCERWSVTAKDGYGDDKNVLKLDCGDGFTTL